MLAMLSEVDAKELPALTYQLLLLAGCSKPRVLGALNRHFERLLEQAQESDDEIVPTQSDLEQLRPIMGTSILHIQFAVKQDAQLGQSLLSLVKKGELALGSFSLPLLLSLARISSFEAPAIAIIVGLVKGAFELSEWSAASPWARQMASQISTLQAAPLLLGAVRSSAAGGWDHLVPSLVRLGCALLDVAPPNNQNAPLALAESAASTAESAEPPAGGDHGTSGDQGSGDDEASAEETARLPQAVRIARLGRRVLLECFRLHPMVRSEMMDEVCSRIVTRADAVHHWVGFLRTLIVSQPSLVLEHLARLKQLMEYVMHLPATVATPLLRTLLPLSRQRPELRDQMVLLLRKAMFHREEAMRLTAVHGFMLLLNTTSEGAAHRPSGGAASSSTPSADGGAQLQQELLGFIRRSLGQQSAIRSALYLGLCDAYAQQPPLRPMVHEILLGQLRQASLTTSLTTTHFPHAFTPELTPPPILYQVSPHSLPPSLLPSLLPSFPPVFPFLPLPLPGPRRQVQRKAHATRGTGKHREARRGAQRR